MSPANFTALLPQKEKSTPILQIKKKNLEVGQTSSNVSTHPVAGMPANLGARGTPGAGRAARLGPAWRPRGASRGAGGPKTASLTGLGPRPEWFTQLKAV